MALRIACLSSDSPAALGAREQLSSMYDFVPIEQADVLLALGGDGLLLHTIHAHRDKGLPIFGMNRGTVGFLMNAFRAEGLPQRIAAAKRETLAPLRMVTEAAGRERA